MDRIDGIIGKLKELIGGKNWYIFFIVLVILFSGMRFFKINADPAPDLSISGALYTDEGFKAYSARNYHLYGDWKWSPQDGYSSWYKKSPIPSYLYRGWFKLFGSGFSAVRSMNVMFGIMTMILIFFMIKRFYNIYTAFVALILFGSNHFTMMYNRLGFYENLQAFFGIATIFALTEAVSVYSSKKKKGNRFPDLEKYDILKIIFFIFTGLALFTAGFLSKQSTVLIFVSIAPFFFLYYFYSHHRLNSQLIKQFYFFLIIMTIGYMLVAHLNWITLSFKHIMNMKFLDFSLNYILPLNRGNNFDPFYLAFVKSVYSEFIYLQPIVFFSGVFFAFFSFYRFLYLKRAIGLDMIFSSWFLFGYMFLAIMEYHPSRYYMLIIVPLIVLTSRFITSADYDTKDELLQYKKFPSLRRFMLFLFWTYFIYYVGLSLLVNFLPYETKKDIYNFVYLSIRKNDIMALVPLILGALLYVALVFLLFHPFVKLIKGMIHKKHLYTGVLFLILASDMFLNLKWAISSEYRLYNLSKKVGEVLPENAVLAGCWSADLALENKIRSLVMQGKITYNLDTTRTIIKNKEITTRFIAGTETKSKKEKDIPLYLAVGTNAPFDRKIMKKFKKYLTPERLVLKENLGLYDVEIYWISGTKPTRFHNE